MLGRLLAVVAIVDFHNVSNKIFFYVYFYDDKNTVRERQEWIQDLPFGMRRPRWAQTSNISTFRQKPMRNQKNWVLRGDDGGPLDLPSSMLGINYRSNCHINLNLNSHH